MKRFITSFAATGLAFSGVSSYAATINYVGAELDYATKATWNTATTTLDIDGDNSAATDGGTLGTLRPPTQFRMRRCRASPRTATRRTTILATMARRRRARPCSNS